MVQMQYNRLHASSPVPVQIFALQDYASTNVDCGLVGKEGLVEKDLVEKALID